MGHFYYFTDTGQVSDQTDADDAFGPQSDATKYRFTHSQSHIGYAPAIAVCTGTICIQRIGTTNTGTIILRPEGQPTFAFPFIQFFIYKNINLTKFYGSAGLASGHDIPFVEDPLFRAKQGSNPEVGAQELLGLTLNGSHPDGGFSITDPVDHLFYTKNEERSLPRVKAGEKIGEFQTGLKCGFEVRLQRLGHNIKLKEVREAESILTVNSSTNNEAEIFEHWHKKDACLNYVDPVAFFGACGETKLRYFLNGDKETAQHRDDIVKDVLSSCVNVDRVYLDLRNDYGFALNYFRDRGHTARLKSRKTSDDYLLDQTITGWPILSFTLDDLDNSGVFPGNIKRGFFRTSLELPQGNNISTALAYLSRGFVRRWRNLKLEEKAPKGITNPGQAYTLPIPISFPTAKKNGADQLCPNYFKVNLYDMNRNQDPATQTTLAPSKDHYLKGLFRPLDMEQAISKRGDSFYFTIWHEEVLVSLASNHGPTYIANVGMAIDEFSATLFSFPKYVIDAGSAARIEGEFYNAVSKSTNRDDYFIDSILSSAKKGKKQVIDLISPHVDQQIVVLDEDWDSKAVSSKSYDIDNYVFLTFSKQEIFDQLTLLGASIGIPQVPAFISVISSTSVEDSRQIPFDEITLEFSYLSKPGSSIEKRSLLVNQKAYCYSRTTINNAHTFIDGTLDIEDKFKNLRVHYWDSTYDDDGDIYRLDSFPEDDETNHDPSLNFSEKCDVGIAFSGGGTVSALHSFGVMRALRNKGLDQKIKYTSAVSGGTWFTIPYTYLPLAITDDNLETTSVNDNKFFGSALTLQEAGDIECVRDKAKSSLFLKVATKNESFHDLANKADKKRPKLNKARIALYTGKEWEWADEVGNAFLKQFNLFFGAHTHHYFTWSDASRDKAISLNPYLNNDDFFVAKRPRPYPILGVSAFFNPLRNAAGQTYLGGEKLRKTNAQFEITPLYAGIIPYNGKIGGGVSSSFGLDRTFKEFEPDQVALLGKRARKQKRFRLSHAIGTASAALGTIGGKAYTPEVTYWPLKSEDDQPTNLQIKALDGGHHENHGIIPLLRRKVPKIIVCDNRGTHFTAIESDDELKNKSKSFLDGRFDLWFEYDDDVYPDPIIPKHINLSPSDLGKLNPNNLTHYLKERISGSMAHLFGFRKKTKTNIAFKMTKKTNQVFDSNKLASLVNGLKKNHDEVGVTFHLDEYTVQENKNYGITPHKVEILWYIPDYSILWSQKIELLRANIDDIDVMETLQGYDKNNGEKQAGFPNPSVWRFDMSPEETALMSGYSTSCFEKIITGEDAAPDLTTRLESFFEF